MTKRDSFRNFVMDQLSDLRSVTSRAMFGGHGLYHGRTFFGIIHESRLYFKTNGDTRKPYIARGMRPFRPNAKPTLKNYYEVPMEIIEDVDELRAWARLAVELPSR